MKRIFQTWQFLFLHTLCTVIRFTIGQPIGYFCDCVVGRGGGGGYQFVSQCVNFRLCHTAELCVTSSSPKWRRAFHLLAVIQRAKKGPVTIINTLFIHYLWRWMTLIKMECLKMEKIKMVPWSERTKLLRVTTCKRLGYILSWVSHQVSRMCS